MRIRSSKPEADLEEAVRDAFDRVGRVKFFSRGEFEVRASRFQGTFVEPRIDGKLSRGRKDGEWVLTVDYRVAPSVTCWVLLVLGVFFLFLLGLLLLLIPYTTKGEMQRVLSNAVRDARDNIEREGD
ncbi:hypothetical protein R5W24_004510 [Gemmata sp. JC717]|uniref:hypothetical protein n=1 Tax=Gemmata algarum TaxID=2975278 RepID=UPI0021BA7901|nr:hypothetical protein [Gemmata algarum]MDY3555367.1 hypothetical protein [Gemmata algarum]